ncbi:MAG: hypothetical protein RL112_1929, partial [Planctomycetota bacterium]
RPFTLAEMRRLYLNRAGDEVATYQNAYAKPKAGGPAQATPAPERR